MNIAVVGLGLIGGSFCKALKKNTFHKILGIDTNKETIKKALECGAIDEEITPEQLCEANLTIICLYPEAIVNFVKANAVNFKKAELLLTHAVLRSILSMNAHQFWSSKVLFS